MDQRQRCLVLLGHQHLAREYAERLTFGTTPTPSPMNIGATVMMILSTNGVPSLLVGLRRKDDSTFDPPSTITDCRPDLSSIPGIEVGAIRPKHSSARLPGDN